jgi:5-formyltetrahydrofolate cyclo-ligase
MLVPLICFNEKRHRIGYGRGYYDNYLRKSNRNIFTIGVGL